MVWYGMVWYGMVWYGMEKDLDSIMSHNSLKQKRDFKFLSYVFSFFLGVYKCQIQKGKIITSVYDVTICRMGLYKKFKIQTLGDQGNNYKTIHQSVNDKLIVKLAWNASSKDT